MRAISSAFPHEFRLIKEIISGQYLTKVNKKSEGKTFQYKVTNFQYMNERYLRSREKAWTELKS